MAKRLNRFKNETEEKDGVETSVPSIPSQTDEQPSSAEEGKDNLTGNEYLGKLLYNPLNEEKSADKTDEIANETDTDTSENSVDTEKEKDTYSVGAAKLAQSTSLGKSEVHRKESMQKRNNRSYTAKHLSHSNAKEHAKSFAVLAISFICGIILFYVISGILRPVIKNVKKEHISDSKNIETSTNEYQFTDEEKQKVLDAINVELHSRYDTNYEEQDISSLSVSGTKEEPLVSNFLVPLTTASNSPTLITEFKLSYDTESDTYKVTYYAIVKSIDNTNKITNQADSTDNAVTGNITVDDSLTDVSQVDISLTTSVTVFVNLENDGKAVVYAIADDGTITEIGTQEGVGGFTQTVNLPSGHYVLALYTTENSGYHWTNSTN